MKSARLLLTLAIAAGLIGYAVWRSSQTGVPEVKLVGFQEADSPMEMPADGKPDMRFQTLSAWQANRIPAAAKMDTPMGSENGALVHGTLENHALKLNGIGGGNTDLGAPVYAAGDGLVVFAGKPSPDRGNTLILAHRDPEGKPVHTVYAHLLNIKATLGSLVARGTEIATVGTASGLHPAHLHFEIRSTDGIAPGLGDPALPLNRLDPTTVIAALHNAEAQGISPAPLAFTTLEADEPWTELEIGNAEKLSELKK